MLLRRAEKHGVLNVLMSLLKPVLSADPSGPRSKGMSGPKHEIDSGRQMGLGFDLAGNMRLSEADGRVHASS